MTDTDRVVFRSKFRDYNSRGRGSEAYRLLATIPPEGTDTAKLYWADQHPDALAQGSQYLSRDTFRAAGRHDACHVEAPVGLLVVQIDKHTSSGISYRAGILGKDAEGKATIDWEAVKHRGVRKDGGGYVHVVQIGDRRLELSS